MPELASLGRAFAGSDGPAPRDGLRARDALPRRTGLDPIRQWHGPGDRSRYNRPHANAPQRNNAKHKAIHRRGREIAARNNPDAILKPYAERAAARVLAWSAPAGPVSPTYVKADSEVEFVIANGAECEPLIHKDAEMMEHFPAEMVSRPGQR